MIWGRLAKVERNNLIYKDRQNGMKLFDIAKKYGLTKARIFAILQMVERRLRTK